MGQVWAAYFSPYKLLRNVGTIFDRTILSCWYFAISSNTSRFRCPFGKALWKSTSRGLHPRWAAVQATSLTSMNYGTGENPTSSLALSSFPHTTKQVFELFTTPASSPVFLKSYRFNVNVFFGRGTTSKQCMSQSISTSEFISPSHWYFFLIVITSLTEGSSSLQVLLGELTENRACDFFYVLG